MRSKKIFNIVLLLIFFISTTGLPITVYLCNSNMETNCETMNRDEMTSCKTQTSASNYSYKSNSKCCQVKVIDQSIKDNFISANSELKINLHASHFQLHLNSINIYNPSNGIISQLTDPSPPGLNSNHLYLNNSILLI